MPTSLLRRSARIAAIIVALWLVIAATFPWWASVIAQWYVIDLYGLPWRLLHMPWVHP